MAGKLPYELVKHGGLMRYTGKLSQFIFSEFGWDVKTV